MNPLIISVCDDTENASPDPSRKPNRTSNMLVVPCPWLFQLVDGQF
jgi:hypothetical protein